MANNKLVLMASFLLFIILMTSEFSCGVKKDEDRACAACKFRRCRCAADCVLRPYFPASRPQVLENVHRLFGINKVKKQLETVVDEKQRDEMARSIIFESNIRSRDPVYGSLGVINALGEKINIHQHELKLTNIHIEFYRNQINRFGSIVFFYPYDHYLPPNLTQNNNNNGAGSSGNANAFLHTHPNDNNQENAIDADTQADFDDLDNEMQSLRNKFGLNPPPTGNANANNNNENATGANKGKEIENDFDAPHLSFQDQDNHMQSFRNKFGYHGGQSSESMTNKYGDDNPFL